MKKYTSTIIVVSLILGLTILFIFRSKEIISEVRELETPMYTPNQSFTPLQDPWCSDNQCKG